MHRYTRTFTPVVGIGLMLAAALLALRSAPAQAASLASLSVTPTHGVPTDKFTAVYQVSPCQSAAGQAVSFYWDGVPPTGGKPLGQAFTDATCSATLAAAPPAGAVVGNHTIWAFLPMNDGSPLVGTSASHGYAVDTPRPSGGASGTSTGGGLASTTGSGQTATSGGVGAGGSQGSAASGNGQGGGNNQASGAGKGFGPAPHLMTPLGLISQAFIGWSLLLLVILLALLMALEYSRREPRQTVTKSPATATASGQRQ